MGKYKIKIEIQAIKDIQYHKKAGNKVVIKKIETILKELSEHPFKGAGNPEPLKYELTGFWS